MGIQSIKQAIASRGVAATLSELAYRAANKVTDVRVLRAMALTPETIDPGYFDESAGMIWDFLDDATLLRAQVQDADAGIDRAFLDEARAKGDRCYGARDGDRVAAYGWYSTQPTMVTDGLALRFGQDWAYMYKGVTLPAYRGRRLHGLAMARAMRAHVEEGKKGLVSYVDATNEASLKSCRRMGYFDLGTLLGAKVGGRWLVRASSECHPFGLALESVASRAPDGPPPSRPPPSRSHRGDTGSVSHA